MQNSLSEIAARGTQSVARINLGLGSLATQSAGAAAITGGTISGLSSLGVVGNATISTLGVTGPATLNGTFPVFPPVSGDATADVMAAVNLADAVGGGTVLFPCQTLLVNGALPIPYTGTTNPVQNPITFQGACSASPDTYLGNSSHGVSTPIGGARLDMRYSGVDGLHPGKIDLRGSGLFNIFDLTLEDEGSDNFLFLQTTNTALVMDRVRFSGNPACLRTTCAQDAIQFGGTSTTLGTDAATAGYQGYGTHLGTIWFDHIRRAAAYGSAANNTIIDNPNVDASSGSSEVHGSAFVFLGEGYGTSGNVIGPGIVEMTGYPHAVAMLGTEQNVLNKIYLGLYDEAMGSPSISAVYYSASSINNTWDSNQVDGALQPSNVPSPGSLFNGFKTDNGISHYPYPINVGTGSGIANITLNGGTASANGGEIAFQGAGGLVSTIGSYSATYGGAYNADLTLYGGGNPVLVPAASGLGVTTGSSNPYGGLGLGDGTAARNITINGGNTNNGDGGALQIRNNGVVYGFFGNSDIYPSTVAYATTMTLAGQGGLIFSTNNTASGAVDSRGHWTFGTTVAPTIASNACGSGTNGSIGAGSNDQAGQIVIGAAATTGCAVGFSAAWTTAPKSCLFSPANAAAAAALAYISALNGNGFTLSGAVLASTHWSYQCQ
jgi:hypothetical protein